MGNISTYHHGRNGGGLGADLWDEGRLGHTSDPTKLRIHLHADVGDVLWRRGHDMLGLEDLRGDAKADVAGLLDAAVDIHIAVVDDEKEEVGRAGVPRMD